MSNDMYNYYDKNYYKCGKALNVKKRMYGYITSYPEECKVEYQTNLIANMDIAEIYLFDLLKEYRHKIINASKIRNSNFIKYS